MDFCASVISSSRKVFGYFPGRRGAGRSLQGAGVICGVRCVKCLVKFQNFKLVS